jgi:predicted Co/Zn/Cd cation transporter (cation efflux family)
LLDKKRKERKKKQKRLEEESEFLRISILATVRAIFALGIFFGGIFSGSLSILTGGLALQFEMLKYIIQGT